MSPEPRTAAGLHTGDSYYGRPILKEPAWKPEVPFYLLVGGISGASSLVSLAARRAGDDRLARTSLLVAVAGDAASAVLLVSDLGRPERFLNMLRVFKVTSPMSVGSWILSGSGAANSLAALLELTGRAPKTKHAVELAGAALGGPLAAYTGALLADTAIPVWHEARRELPVVFAGSANASAGALLAILLPREHAGPARRLAVLGTMLEGASMQVMQRRLGFVGEPYSQGAAGKLALAAKALATTGAAVLALGGRRRRSLAVAGGSLLLAGETCLRWSVFRAGFQSARDPRYVVEPQRRRLGKVPATVSDGVAAGRAPGR